MIDENIVELCNIILNKHKTIRESNLHEMVFVYDFWGSKANALKITKRNSDYIKVIKEGWSFDIEINENDSCREYFGYSIDGVSELIDMFLDR